MTTYIFGLNRILSLWSLLTGVLLVHSVAFAAGGSPPDPSPAKNRVTILYDAFGKDARLTKDWGYSALIEYEGKRILFDTGNNEAVFKHSVETIGVDLKHLDFVVISHRHGDHTSGLAYVL